jgi:hypothetical protein
MMCSLSPGCVRDNPKTGFQPPDSRGGRGCFLLTAEPLVKLPMHNSCHSERSEESRFLKKLRSFTSFRMTEKPILQEALLIAKS